MSHPEIELKAPPRKKRRWPLYILLLILLGLAAAGAWGGYQFMRNGEVVIALPDSLAPLVAEKLGADSAGRLGPFRFDSTYFSQGSGTAGPDLSYPLGTNENGQPGQSGVPVGGLAGGAGGTGEQRPARVTPDGRIALRPDQVLREPGLPRIDEKTGLPAGGVAESPGSGQYVTPRDISEIPPPPLAEDPYLDGSGRTADSSPVYPESPSQARARAQRDGQPPVDASPTISASLYPETEARELMPPAASGSAASGRVKIYSGEDSVVTLEFIEDLAAYLARNYWPTGSHPAALRQPVCTATVKSINQRYGIDLKGFAGSNSSVRDYYRDRGLILNYVFMPSMLQALTRLYADRFADALARAGSEPIPDEGGKERRLTPAENAAMLEFYADSIGALGAAFGAYAESPNAQDLTSAYTRAESESFAAHARFLDAQQAQTLAVESGDGARILEAERDVARLERAYHISRGKLKRAEDEVCKFMAQGKARRLDAESLVYTACWLNRRGAQSGQSVKAAADGAAFVSRVLGEKAAEMRFRR